MSAPYYPGGRPPFGGELQEILRRLDLMERKIDWIAQRVVKPAQSPSAGDGARFPIAPRVGFGRIIEDGRAGYCDGGR